MGGEAGGIEATLNFNLLSYNAAGWVLYLQKHVPKQLRYVIRSCSYM